MNPPASASFRSILGEKNFARLWYGQIISSLGDRFYQFALLSVVLGIKGGMDVGKDSARVTFCAMLPGLLFAPLYGWVVDHFSRRWVMFWSDIARAVLTISLLYFWFERHDLIAVFIVIFLMGALNGLFIPARQAALPQIVEPAKLIPANALISLIGVIANLVGALFAALIVSIFGARSSFLFNAMGFLTSAWFIYHITANLSPGEIIDRKKTGFWRSSLEGWHVLREQRELGPIVLVKSAFSFISALVLVTMLQQIVGRVDLSLVQALAGSLAHFLTHFAPKPPVFDIRMLGIGILFGSIGLGVGLGVLVCGRAQRWSHSKALPYVALAGLGMALVIFASLREYGPALIGAVFLGLLTSLILIPIEARLQNDVDDARRGRLFALCNLCTTVSFLLGFAVNLDGRLLSLLGPAALIQDTGILTLILAVVLALANASTLSSFWSAGPPKSPYSPE